MLAPELIKREQKGLPKNRGSAPGNGRDNDPDQQHATSDEQAKGQPPHALAQESHHAAHRQQQHKLRGGTTELETLHASHCSAAVPSWLNPKSAMT